MNSERFPVQFLIEHCENSLIAYIGKNFEVKGIESVNNILKIKNGNQDDHIKGQPITPEFIQNISSEEKLVLSSNYDFDNLKNQEFPNVIEKQILLQISKNKEISVAVLLKKLTAVTKAINKSIDQKTLLKIIDKYVEKGIINKNFIKLEKENPNFKIGMNIRGDVI
ncbi:MAG: hypothetical protein ACFE96_11220 [Candidatus Hermodarchaeota archaeon]